MIFGRCRLFKLLLYENFFESFVDVFISFKLKFVRLLEGASVLLCSIEFVREVDAVSFVREAKELCGALLESSFRRGDIALMEKLV